MTATGRSTRVRESPVRRHPVARARARRPCVGDGNSPRRSRVRMRRDATRESNRALQLLAIEKPARVRACHTHIRSPSRSCFFSRGLSSHVPDRVRIRVAASYLSLSLPPPPLPFRGRVSRGNRDAVLRPRASFLRVDRIKRRGEDIDLVRRTFAVIAVAIHKPSKKIHETVGSSLFFLLPALLRLEFVTSIFPSLSFAFPLYFFLSLFLTRRLGSFSHSANTPPPIYLSLSVSFTT